MDSKPRQRAGAICTHEGRLLVVKFREPSRKTIYLFPPGGGIEPGEIAEVTAVRETKEETGYRVSVEPSSRRLARYPFFWDDVTYDCETTFFAARLVDEKQDDYENLPFHLGVQWLPLARVRDAFDYEPAIKKVILALVDFC